MIIAREVSIGESKFKHGVFTQSAQYADWQIKNGKKVRCFEFADEVGVHAFMQIIVYPLWGKYTYCYAPYGPVVKNMSDELLTMLKEKCKEIAKEECAVFVRLDCTPKVVEGMHTFFTPVAPVLYKMSTMQPRANAVLALNDTNENLLAKMEKDTRYSIRQSEARGITTEVVQADFAQHYETFAAIMSETAERNNFSAHSKAYTKIIFDSLSANTNNFVVLAKREDEIVGVGVFVEYAGITHYILGCTKTKERNSFPGYAFLWKAIQHAAYQLSTQFSFGGVTCEEFPVPSLKQLTDFKLSFGASAEVASPFFDLVNKPLLYKALSLYKLLRTR